MRSGHLPPALLERVRTHLVALRMPRALEMLDHVVGQLERGEVSALEAIDALLVEEFTIRDGRRVGVVQNLPFSGYTGARKLPAREGRIFGSKVVQCRRRSASPTHTCLG